MLQQDLSSLLSSYLTPLSLPPPTIPRDAALPQKLRTDALIDLFRTYASVNKFREAEEVIKRQVVTEHVVRIIHREALMAPQSPLMPMTPLTTQSLTGAAMGLRSQDTGHAFPFAPMPAGNSVIDDRSSIPAFYMVDPIPPPSSTNTGGDTQVSDALVDLYNKLLLLVSKDLGLILDITERRQGAVIGDREVALNSLAVNGHFRDGVIGDLTVPNSPAGRERARVSEKAGFEVLSNVVWNEIANRLTNELGHVIFSAGRTDTFHRVGLQ